MSRDVSEKLAREAERCWLEGINLINRGTKQMERAFSLMNKVADESKALIEVEQ